MQTTTTRRRGLLDMREAARQIHARDDDNDRRWLYKHRKDLPSELFVRGGGRIFVKASRLAQWLGTDGEPVAAHGGDR